MTGRKKFDLNIEEILENWDISDGIREIISNALDEQKITNSKIVEIFKSANTTWHIRDYGRGIKYEHLTQKENEEKKNHPNLIGKFGIGLKDALATFDRNNVKVLIKSKHGEITIEKMPKHGFEDIPTLHAIIAPASDDQFQGTEVVLENVDKNDIEKAKSLFLIFSGDKLIEETMYGEVYQKEESLSSIYINGVKVADEPNFLFSYNITSLTKKISNALNRERTNVGRNAYTDRVKSILLKCSSESIAAILKKDLQEIANGISHDELSWIDIQEHAVKILNTQENVIFMTSSEQQNNFNHVDTAQNRGLEIVTIPENLKSKISKTKDLKGNVIRDMEELIKEDHRSFEYKFIPPSQLTRSELKIWNQQDNIFKLYGGKPRIMKEIRISETMRKDPISFQEVVGQWDSMSKSIIIKRDQLKKLESFAGTLIHECVHASSGESDVTRMFEKELTKAIGKICNSLMNN